MRLLSRAMILEALEALARELAAMETRRQEEIVLAGGAALVLMYNAREATRDVDFCSVATGAASVPPAPKRLFLVRAAASMPRLRSLCELEGPEPLRRRGLLAPPEFLSIA